MQPISSYVQKVVIKLLYFNDNFVHRGDCCFSLLIIIHGKVIMSKSVWLFIFCVFSTKIITAAPSAVPQMPVLSEGITDSTSCSPDSHCQEPEPIQQDVRESALPETKTSSKNSSPSILKESIENPILDADTDARKWYNIELEATEYNVTDINAINYEETLKSTTVTKKNEDVKDKLTPKTELSSQQYSRNHEILTKIETAVSKSKENKNEQTFKAVPDMVPIFRPKCSNVRVNNNENNIQIVKKCTTESPAQNLKTGALCEELPNQSTVNFSITGVYLKPLVGNDVSFISSENTANIKAVNIAPLTKTTDLRSLAEQSIIPSDVRLMPNILSSLSQGSQNMQFSNVPSVLPKSNNAVMVLYKPETISLEQFYGEFMKKLTITVLVPYYISKLTSIQNSR